MAVVKHKITAVVKQVSEIVTKDKSLFRVVPKGSCVLREVGKEII